MLSELQVRNAAPKAKQYRLSDGGSLYVVVTPKGSKLFQVRYFLAGKEKILSLGPYDTQGRGRGLTLKEAREKRDAAMRLVRDGKDPVVARRVEKALVQEAQAMTFERLTLAWLDVWKTRWTDKYAANILLGLQKDVFPKIGRIPASEVTRRMVLDLVLLPIEERGANDWVRKARIHISAAYRFGQVKQLVPEDYNPAPEELVRALKAKPRVTPQAALCDVAELVELFRTMEGRPAKPITRLAARFLALSALRTTEMRHMTWDMLKPGKQGGLVLQLPFQLMKHRKPFDVRLSERCVEIIDAARTISGSTSWVFPSDRSETRPMTENAVLSMLDRAGYKGRHTGHGFRAAFSTIMNERHPDMRHVIDFALAHTPPNKTEAAYNRASYLDLRYELQNEYADLIFGDLPPTADLMSGLRH